MLRAVETPPESPRSQRSVPAPPQQPAPLDNSDHQAAPATASPRSGSPLLGSPKAKPSRFPRRAALPFSVATAARKPRAALLEALSQGWRPLQEPIPSFFFFLPDCLFLVLLRTGPLIFLFNIPSNYWLCSLESLVRWYTALRLHVRRRLPASHPNFNLRTREGKRARRTDTHETCSFLLPLDDLFLP
ncbi:hypothetical protein BDY21DRAFT_341550 [Lineolata rhizophorae]|uniref:Uncharacterized protein n=1 Tax=Lineolata rhizophorae TaxID=578093 RepID=A0A6A6P268_9PEZI|nr:hypothetical protein BDY21DRAFT_341550 [Lineolata rhizophorae]